MRVRRVRKLYEMFQNEGKSATKELESLKVLHHENQYRHSIYPERPSSQDTKHSVPGKVPSPSPFSSSITLRGETTKSAIEPGSKTQIKKQKKKSILSEWTEQNIFLTKVGQRTQLNELCSLPRVRSEYEQQ